MTEAGNRQHSPCTLAQPGDSRPIVEELVVVEGVHDKQAVDAAVQADVWVLGGDRVARATLDALRRAVATRGVIVLTDPDGPGERIRRRLSASIPGCRHAFISKAEARSARGIGIEHASVTAIRRALAAARGPADPAALTEPAGQTSATPAGYKSETPAARAAVTRGGGRMAGGSAEFSLQDLLDAGLAGVGGAAERRALVGQHLRIGVGNAKAFVQKLNTLGVTRSEWDAALQWMRSVAGDGH